MAFDDLGLLFDLQKWFGLRLEPPDFRDIQTAGDFERFIAGRVQLTDEFTCCPTAAAFRKLQRIIAGEFRLDPEGLEPRTSTVALFRRKGLHVAWRAVGRSAGIRLDPLQFPEILLLPALVAGLLAFVPPFAISLMNIPCPNLMAVVAGLPVSVSLFYLLERGLSLFLPAQIPPYLRTLDGFAYLIVLQRQKSRGTWTREQLWAASQLLLARAAYASPRRIHRTTRLADLAQGPEIP